MGCAGSVLLRPDPGDRGGRAGHGVRRGAWQAAARLDLVASQAGGGVRGREVS